MIVSPTNEIACNNDVVQENSNYSKYTKTKLIEKINELENLNVNLLNKYSQLQNKINFYQQELTVFRKEKEKIQTAQEEIIKLNINNKELKRTIDKTSPIWILNNAKKPWKNKKTKIEKQIQELKQKQFNLSWKQKLNDKKDVYYVCCVCKKRRPYADYFDFANNEPNFIHNAKGQPKCIECFINFKVEKGLKMRPKKDKRY